MCLNHKQSEINLIIPVGKMFIWSIYTFCHLSVRYCENIAFIYFMRISKQNLILKRNGT